MSSDTWIINEEWIAPGRTPKEAIAFLSKCGVPLQEINFVYKMDS